MSSYFTNTTSKGELQELQEQLNSMKADIKQEAVRKVIAAMTVGKDVASLFPHVVKCMETTSVELKKLVYLYIINYARSQPDLAIMAVNSFIKDARQKSSPLIRALAVRTMGCIRVERITEYLCQPLKDALADEDPYVRKTAAICLAKLYDISPEMVEDQGFFQQLTGLLADGNAMVVANAVAAIAEISDLRGSPVIPLTHTIANRVLTALNDSTEWGQVIILDYIAMYTPAASREAEGILERVIPRLAHANPAVVLAAVKVIVKYLDYLSSADLTRTVIKKLTPPLVTLLTGSQPEVQYVTLRCVNLIVQKNSAVLDKDVRAFFCKFNDPIYVKMEKLEILTRLADNKNIDSVLQELKEYSTEVDMEFVRKAIRCIGRCALKLERATERCVNVLLDLVHTKVSYVVQETTIVVRDILRRYPGRYEMIIREILDCISDLDDSEAKAAYIWILGEHAEKIENAFAQLSEFCTGFLDEPGNVQLQLLTAAVKLFLKRPEQAEVLISALLKTATEKCPNPDVRDRAYIYWRLLSTDPAATRELVLSEKPAVADVDESIPVQTLDKLIEQIGFISSVNHVLMEKSTSKVRETAIKQDQENDNDDFEIEGDIKTIQKLETPPAVPLVTDLLSLDMEIAAVAPAKSLRAAVPLQPVLTAEVASSEGKRGLAVRAAFQRVSSETMLELEFTNGAEAPITEFAVQFNVNYFGLTPASPIPAVPLSPASTRLDKVKIASADRVDPAPPSVPLLIQAAIKCSLGIFYFQVPCMLTALLVLRN